MHLQKIWSPTMGDLFPFPTLERAPIETRAKSYMDRFNSEIGNVEKKLFRQ
jgi:hypothetical protein